MAIGAESLHRFSLQNRGFSRGFGCFSDVGLVTSFADFDGRKVTLKLIGGIELLATRGTRIKRGGEGETDTADAVAASSSRTIG